MPEHALLANIIIDEIGALGYHVEVYRSHVDLSWCEVVAVCVESGERWRVESDDLYSAVCEMAGMVGMSME